MTTLCAHSRQGSRVHCCSSYFLLCRTTEKSNTLLQKRRAGSTGGLMHCLVQLAHRPALPRWLITSRRMAKWGSWVAKASMMRSASRPYKQCLVLGFQPGRLRCCLMKPITLCSPSPGTLASDRITCIAQVLMERFCSRSANNATAKLLYYFVQSICSPMICSPFEGVRQYKMHLLSMISGFKPDAMQGASWHTDHAKLCLRACLACEHCSAL